MQVSIPSVLNSIRTLEANQGGAITVTGSDTPLVSLDCGLLIVGQIVLFTLRSTLQKGGTDGVTRLLLDRAAGSGLVLFPAVQTSVSFSMPQHVSTTFWEEYRTFIGRVTVTGSYTARLSASSLDSDSDSPANAAYLMASIFLR